MDGLAGIVKHDTYPNELGIHRDGRRGQSSKEFFRRLANKLSVSEETRRGTDVSQQPHRFCPR
jgi:hypothetical protein